VTGGGLLGWRFKDRTPFWFKAIALLLIGDAALHFTLLMTVSNWALSSADAAHSHRVPFRDGNVYFVSWRLGWYLDAWWIAPGLFAILVLLLFINREQIERAS
jgi:hypothetical protein